MVLTGFKRKLSAILSADVAGYCCLMQDDEEATIHSLNKYKEILFGLVKGYNGRIVDSPGDNILAEFSSVVDAVKCSIQIQEEFRVYNEELPKNRKMEFRIGINTGDVIQDGNGIYGDGVNVTARIESLADPGGVCISRTAYDQVKKKVKIDYEYLGEFEVKNIDEPVRIYKILFKHSSNDSGFKENLDEKAIIKIKKRSASGKPSIAVLPFVNLSSDAEQEYFVDGLSEEILNRLSSISGLRVIARTSSFSFKGTNKTIQSIAGILGVDNILEGSVRKSGKAMRISTQLIKVDDGSHLWSETYKRELKDIFEVQEEIAVTVARELQLKLCCDKISRKLGYTDNLEAYELFLTVQGQIWQESERNLDIFGRMLKTLDKAISLDPNFALALVLRSIIQRYYVAFGSNIDVEAQLDIALKSAKYAIELEPNLSDGYSALGGYEVMKGNWFGAESAFQRAVELETETLAESHYMGHVLYEATGHFKKMHEVLEDARKNDPLNTDLRGEYLLMCGYLGDTYLAEKEYLHGRALFGSQWDAGNERMTILRLGYGSPLSPDMIVYSSPISNVAKDYLYSPGDGLSTLYQIYSNESNLSESEITDIMLWAAYFGDLELAIDAMENGLKINAMGAFKIWSPVMKEVRQLPRFKEFVREIGLVDYWKQYGWPDLCHPVDNDDFVCD